MSTYDIFVEKQYHRRGFRVQNSAGFGPFGQIFRGYNYVGIASFSSWERSNYIHSYTIEGLSNFNGVKRLVSLILASSLAFVTTSYVFSYVIEHLWPVVTNLYSSIGFINEKVSCKGIRVCII